MSRRLRWQLQEWAPRQIRLDIQAPEAGTLTLHQYYYPGWVARRAEQEAPLALHPSGDGLLQITLPAGNYPLTVPLTPLARRAGGALDQPAGSARLPVAGLAPPEARYVNQGRQSTQPADILAIWVHLAQNACPAAPNDYISMS